MYKVNVTKISCNVNCCIHAHILKHIQVCVCTLTHTHTHTQKYIFAVWHRWGCKYFSFMAKLLKRPKLCCQSAFCLHHFWWKPAFLHTWDAVVHSYCLLSCRYAHRLISRIRQNTCRWSCPLCSHTPDCRNQALLHTRWCLGGKERKNKHFQWPRKVIHSIWGKWYPIMKS